MCRKNAKTTPYPNGLGWYVQTRHGEATVTVYPDRLAVTVPLAPVKRWVDHPLVGLPRWVTDWPRGISYTLPGMDPVDAVRKALRGELLSSRPG